MPIAALSGSLIWKHRSGPGMDEQHDEGRTLTVSEALDAVGALQMI